MNELPRPIQRIDQPVARNPLLISITLRDAIAGVPQSRSETALGQRFGRMASNIPRLAVTALAERLRITGFVCDEPILWDDWIANDMDQIVGRGPPRGAAVR